MNEKKGQCDSLSFAKQLLFSKDIPWFVNVSFKVSRLWINNFVICYDSQLRNSQINFFIMFYSTKCWKLVIEKDIHSWQHQSLSISNYLFVAAISWNRMCIICKFCCAYCSTLLHAISNPHHSMIIKVTSDNHTSTSSSPQVLWPWSLLQVWSAITPLWFIFLILKLCTIHHICEQICFCDTGVAHKYLQTFLTTALEKNDLIWRMI